jgi:translation initiation factor IF-3
VIAPDGEQLGVMTPDEGREHAKARGMDLVEVAPDARPAVCKIMDYGKFRYEQDKRASASRTAKVETKTLRFRPNTDEHDLKTKLGKAERFLSKGNKVRLVMRMRGRERAHVQRWVERLSGLISRLDDRVDQELQIVARPNAEGRQITAMVAPVS